MKGKHIFLIILLAIFLDQALKFYVKLNFIPGERHNMFGTWSSLTFVENEGMAWGWKFGGTKGKLVLTLFRLIAVIWGSFFIKNLIEKKYHKGVLVCAALMYAGALGNLIDSLFYGLIFDINADVYHTYAHVFTGKGYGTFLHGRVVDMLYFPLIENAHYPAWLIKISNGYFNEFDTFTFFSPVFNFADACISCGVITLIIFQNKFFPKQVVNS